MKYTVQRLAVVIAWFAVITALVCQVRIEALRPQWSSQVPSGVLLLINLAFTLWVVLTAIAVRGRRRFFWIGCSAVAVILMAAQLADLKPIGIVNNLAILVEPWLFANELPGHVQNVFRTGHRPQLGILLFYCWLPWVSLLGGWYTLRVAKQQPTVS